MFQVNVKIYKQDWKFMC